MAIFNTVWSLDVGRSSLKAVKLRREKNNIEILEVDKVDYTTGPDGIDFASQSREALSIFKSRNNVKEPVIVCHNGQGTLSRFIKIPAFDPKKVKEMVGYEAQQQIPFPLDEVIWDHHIIDRDYMPGEEREVGLFAARREAIEDYLVDFEAEELDVEGVTIGYLGLLNYILYDIAPEEPTIFLDMGASHTDLILVDGKKFWTRNLPHSGSDMTKAVQTRLKLNFAEAEKIKIFCGKNKAQAAKIFAAIIVPKLKDLVNEIQRSIGYYRTQSGEVQFKQVYLLGGASKIIGAKKYLQEHMGIPVHTLQGISRLRINRDANLKLLQSHLPAFATAFGSALQGVGVGSCRVDLLPQEEKIQKEVGRKKKHVFIALAALYVAVLACGFVIQGKVISEDSSQLEAPQEYVKRVKRIERDLKKIEQTDISKEAKLLVDVAELRRMPQTVLSMLGEVLAALPNGQPQFLKEVTGPDREAQIADLKKRTLEQLAKSAWVPYVNIEKIAWTDPSLSENDLKSAPTVPAYRVNLRVFVQSKGNPEESLNHLSDLVADPLKRKLRKLREDGLIQNPEFSVSTDFAEVQRIYHAEKTTSSRSTRRSRSSKEEVVEVQEGGPFFSAGLSFVLRTDEPPKKAASDEDD